MSRKRKSFAVTLTVTAPAWMTPTAVRREVRAIMQGFPGFETDHGDGRTLDDVGTGNGLRAKGIKAKVETA